MTHGAMPRPPHYDEPFYWWGNAQGGGCCLDAADLLRDETIDPECGAIIWAAMERRLSVAVIGGPSGLGKSTLLWAMLDFLPSPTRRIFIRGNYETFEFLEIPGVVPGSSVLLINEISPHLPVYAWEGVVRGLLALETAGFQIAATAHAGSVGKFLALLAGSPLRVPVDHVAAFKLVVLVEPTSGVAQGPRGSRVTEIWRLSRTKTGVRTDALYKSDSRDISPEVNIRTTPQTSFIPLSEATVRSDWLRKVRDGEAGGFPFGLSQQDVSVVQEPSEYRQQP